MEEKQIGKVEASLGRLQALCCGPPTGQSGCRRSEGKAAYTLAMTKLHSDQWPCPFTIQAPIRSCPQEPGNQADIFKS